jgi:hypothetical protein
MQLRWTANHSVSALHAAEMLAVFPTQITDARVKETIASFVTKAEQLIQTRGADPKLFWNRLISVAAEIEANFPLVQTTLLKCGIFAEVPFINSLAGPITDIEAAFKQLFPKYQEQVELRIRPLQEQWLGFGTGLMAHVGRLTEKSVIADEARIIPVQPVIGGYGWAHIENNLVRIEAMLTNPMAEIPEVVRLGWLVSQLQLELPRFSEVLGAHVLHRVAPFAMLPPVLAAAQVLELSECSNENVALAIQNWHIPLPSDMDLHDHVVPTLLDWWETYLTTKPSWHVAMQALGKMFGILSSNVA